MDEKRILDKLDRIAEDAAATRTDIKNLYEYIKAVSINQKETAKSFQDHKEDPKAHGLGGIIQWGTFALAGAALLKGFLK